MTGLGSRRVNLTGRSTGRRKTNRFTELEVPFAAWPIRMLEFSGVSRPQPVRATFARSNRN